MNNKLLVDERQADIGNFLVGRLLPFRKKRQVGPFTFIDHMGPYTIGGRNGYMDVDQHPHIGLSTLTYLFQGEIEHRDSTGAHQIIRPGDVGFMTAGKAVTHTERIPAHLRDGREYPMHGYQIWVALPKELEEMTPRFDYLPATEVPFKEEEGMLIRVPAGRAFGLESSLPVYSELFMADVLARRDGVLDIRSNLSGEVAMVIVEGTLTDEGETVGQGQMLISKVDHECTVNVKAGTHLLLFGGQPFPEERFLLWNFVASNKERLQRAKAQWEAKAFPEVPGDETYIPFPGFKA